MNDRAPVISIETCFFRDHGQFDLLCLPPLTAPASKRNSAEATSRLKESA